MPRRDDLVSATPLLSPVNASVDQGRPINSVGRHKQFDFDDTDDYYSGTTFAATADDDDDGRVDVLSLRLERWQQRSFDARCSWDQASPRAPRVLRAFLWVAGVFPARSSLSSYAFSALRLAILTLSSLLNILGARSGRELNAVLPMLARDFVGLYMTLLISWTAHAGLNEPPVNPKHPPLRILAPHNSELWKPPATPADCVGDATLFELVAVAPRSIKSRKENVLMAIWAGVSIACLVWVLFNAFVLGHSQYKVCPSTFCKVYMVILVCMEAPYYTTILTLTALYGYVCMQLGKITQDSVDRSLKYLHVRLEEAARVDATNPSRDSITTQNSLAVIFRSRLVVQAYVKRVSERYRFVIATFLAAMVIFVFAAVMDVVVYQDTLDSVIVISFTAFIISLQALIFLWFPALLISGADNLRAHVRVLRGALGQGIASAQLASELSDLESFLSETKVAFFLFDQTLDMATAKAVTTALTSIFSVIASVAVKMKGSS